MATSQSGSGWLRLAKGITSPIGLVSLIFIADIFCLRILLPISNTSNNATNTHIAYCLTGIAVLLVLVVCGLLIFKPENLIFDQEAILRNRGKAPFGTEKKSTKKESEEKNVTPNA